MKRSYTAKGVQAHSKAPVDSRPLPGPTSASSVLRSNLGALMVIFFAVGLQVFGAVLLKTIADHCLEWPLSMLAAGISVVFCLNLVRLVIWGIAHKRYPLSTTFPMSSLFFPVMLVVAVLFGDDIGVRQVVGATFITFGTAWLSIKVQP